MDKESIKKLLEDVQGGTLSPEDALGKLSGMPYEDIGFARIDHHRALRKGFPEVIFSQGKTVEQTTRIFQHLAEKSDRVLATRVTPETAQSVLDSIPGTEYHPAARALVLDRKADEPRIGSVVVVSAGTSDLPVAEEASITAHLMGASVHRIQDAGVAGIHRILSEGETLQKARVVVVVAGMEGALPSVVGGLVAVPVIAVPTSIGYGASFGGLAALLGMLNSCASGVSVVNIDNGFGAGFQAALINRLPERVADSLSK